MDMIGSPEGEDLTLEQRLGLIGRKVDAHELDRLAQRDGWESQFQRSAGL
jgi:hypothetical protein